VDRNAPAEYVDRVPRVVDVDGVPSWSIDGVVLSRASASGVIRPDGEKAAGVEFLEWSIDEVHPGAYRHGGATRRLDELDIYAQICIRTSPGSARRVRIGRGPGGTSPLRDALQRRDGRDPGGSKGASFRWASCRVGCRGSSPSSNGAPRTGCAASPVQPIPRLAGAAELGQPEWEPFWAACAEHEMPVNFHIGASDTSMSWFGVALASLDEDRKIADRSAMMYLSIRAASSPIW